MSKPSKFKIKQDASLQKARAVLANNDDDEAMKNFKRACVLCDCNKALLENWLKTTTGRFSFDNIPLPACHCRDIMSLDPDNDNKQAICDLAMKLCTCGGDVKSCEIQAHIDGLNGMAAICGRRKAYKDACRYASLLILMAPRNPTGYLRLAKTLRLRDASEGTDFRKRWEWIYSQVRRIDPTKLKELPNVLRVDIVRKSPPEIQEMILKHLSRRDLCRSMRVSKAWNRAALNASLWRHLEFIKLWSTNRIRPFPKGVLNDIISRRSRNLAQSLVISGLREFAIDETRLSSILKGLPHLQVLSLHDTAPNTLFQKHLVTNADAKQQCLSFQSWFSMLCRDAAKDLKALHLEGFIAMGKQEIREARHLMIRMPATINFAASLRELTLAALHDPDLVLCMMTRSTRWPRLEKLHISNCRHSGIIDLESLAPAMPSLRDLELRYIKVKEPSHDNPDPHIWQKLERVSLEATNSSYIPHILHILLALRSLEVSGPDADFFDLGLPQVDYSTALEKMEHLRYDTKNRYVPGPSTGGRTISNVIKPSCKNGTLWSLDIDFNPRQWDDVLDKPAIRTLSCNHIRSPSIHPGGSAGDTDAFLDWLDGFPNVTTLGIFPERGAENAWLTVAKTVRKLDERTSLVKTIYTNALRGVYMDEVLAEAARKGIQIIHADRVPEPELRPLSPSGEVVS